MLTIPVDGLKDARWEKVDFIFSLGVIGNGVWLAGGALQTLVKPDIPVKDFDLFFHDKELVAPTKKKLEDNGYNEIFACPRGELYTLRHEDNTEDDPNCVPDVQLITKFYYAGMYSVIDSFDFTVTQWITDGNELVTTHDAIRHTKKMTLHIHKVTFPVATMNRIAKYRYKKGFYVPEKTMVEFITIVNDPSHTFTGDELALYVD